MRSGRTIRVPATEARGVRVPEGTTVTVRDLAGAQVGDLFAFVEADPTEFLSASHTRSATRRLFPAIGEPFVTTGRRPLLTLTADTSPGIHDLLLAACDPARYTLLGADASHRSCAQNLREVARDFAFEPIVTPQPVNLFMNTPPLADGSIDYRQSTSAPGDAISFRAELDTIVIVSSCPMDLIEISGGGLSDLQLELG